MTVCHVMAGFVSKNPRLQMYGVEPQLRAVELVGAPDWEACQRLVAAVVNATAGCGSDSRGTSSVAAGQPQHCLLGTVQPELQARTAFVAYT